MLILDKTQYDYINNNKTDRKIDNLQMLTSSQNIKKSVIRYKTYFQNIRKNDKFIKSTCVKTGDIDYYHSTYLAEKIDICSGEISITCNNNYKCHKMHHPNLIMKNIHLELLIN